MPRKPATNAVRGRSYSSFGRAELLDLPWFITAIVSAIVIASSWSCVTWTKVMPTSFWIRFSSSCICLRSFRSSAPSGSSSRRTRGLLTIARASATRCCWPPESCVGFRFAAREVDELEHLGHARADLALRDPALARARRRCPRSTCAGTARSSGRPCSRRACRAAGRRRRGRRAGSAPRSAPRSRRSSERRRLAAARRAEQREERAARISSRSVDRAELGELLDTSTRRTSGAIDVIAAPVARAHADAPVVELLPELEVEEALGGHDLRQLADPVPRDVQQPVAVDADDLDEDVEPARQTTT